MEHYENETKKLLTFVAFMVSFSAAITIFFPSLIMKIDDIHYQLLGINSIFGGNATFHYNFNILGFLGYLGVLAATILMVLSFKFEKKITYILSTLFYLASVLLFVFTKQGFILANKNEAYINNVSSYSLGLGSILAIIFNGISLIISLIITIKELKGDHVYK